MIRLDSLKLKYGMAQELNLHFYCGEIWGILGPNGTGKTTCLLTIANLLKPTQGKVFIEGTAIQSLHPKIVAQTIGLLQQHNHLHQQQTVWEYCADARFPHQRYWQRVLLNDKNVHDALTQMNLQQYTTRRIHTLSGGEKRRVSIAALLAQTPHVYLLDEPTNHLDIKYQYKTLEIFKHIGQRALVIMSLHDINLAQQYCDKILMLYSDGNYLAGDKHEVLTSANVGQLYQHSMQLIEHAEKKFWLG